MEAPRILHYWPFIIYISCFVFVLSCNDKYDNNTGYKASATTNATPSVPVKHAKPINYKYEVIKKESDNRGPSLDLDVYLYDSSAMYAVNGDLITLYNPNNNISLNIYYYDNKNVAKSYRKDVMNNRISDDVIDKMSKHLLGYYSYAPNVGGNWNEIE